jgi:hypothetical protein
MARKSGGTGSVSTHKRVASTTATLSEESKRVKTRKVTPTKSQYFKSTETDLSEDLEDPSSEEGEASEFGEDDQGSDASEEDEGDEDYDSEEEPRKVSARDISLPHLSASRTTSYHATFSALPCQYSGPSTPD